MISYLLLSRDRKTCYSLEITWENGETFCRMDPDHVADGITTDEVRAHNLMMYEHVDSALCPAFVIDTNVYFGGHTYYIQDGILYRDKESIRRVPWYKLEDILNEWMKKRPFTITPEGNRFRLKTADTSEVKEVKKVCIKGTFYETIDFTPPDFVSRYNKPMAFPIPENDDRFVPYCYNRNELLSVLHYLNEYEEDKQDYRQLENGNWTITERVLSRLYERVIGSPNVKTVKDIKKIIKFLDNV